MDRGSCDSMKLIMEDGPGEDPFLLCLIFVPLASYVVQGNDLNILHRPSGPVDYMDHLK